MPKNYKVSIDDKKFSNYELKKYELEHGVKITRSDNRNYFQGSSSQIEKVKGQIRKEIFLKNNPTEPVKIKEGSLSSQLNRIEFKPKYGSIYSSGSTSKDIFSPKEFVFH